MFFPKVWKFIAEYRKNIQKIIAEKMSSKTYFWQVEYSIENPAEKLWPNVWKVFAQNRNAPWQKYFEKKIFQEASFWQVKYSLDKPAGNFLAKWPQRICQKSKVIQKDEMFQKKISANCSSRQVDCSFDDSAKNFFE